MSAHGQLHSRIWDTVLRVPPGRVASYGQIAAEAGLPGHARLVGYALHRLPEDSAVPWHRVLNARGRISLPIGSDGHALQRALLEGEGVVFEGDVVDLARFGWKPGWR